MKRARSGRQAVQVIPQPRAAADLLEGRALRVHPQGDLLEGDARALAAGHGPGGRARVRLTAGGVGLHEPMVMKLKSDFKFNPDRRDEAHAPNRNAAATTVGCGERPADRASPSAGRSAAR